MDFSLINIIFIVELNCWTQLLIAPELSTASPCSLETVTVQSLLLPAFHRIDMDG